MVPQAYFLALVFGIHIVAVNLGIAISTLVPFLKRRADLTNDEDLSGISKRIFKIYAATYALAGVMGTAFTVFLLSFYPEFVGIAGNVTLIPFALAILSILIHFLAIVSYYYGWERFGSRTHFMIGVILALTSYTIPLGFRAVFSFLNTPIGLHFDGKPYLNFVEALTNPTFLPLYLKSILGAIAFGSLFLSTVAVLNSGKRSGAENEVYSTGLRIATASLFFQLLLGAWYSLSLLSTPLKFNNVFGSFGWSIAGAERTSDYSWLFALKVIFVLIQVVILLELAFRRSFEEPKHADRKLIFLATFSAALTVLLGEYLNMFSQYPFFLANLPMIAPKIPEPWRTILGRALSLENVSPLANDPLLLSLTSVGIAILLLAAGYFIYLVFVKEEEGSPH